MFSNVLAVQLQAKRLGQQVMSALAFLEEHYGLPQAKDSQSSKRAASSFYCSPAFESHQDLKTRDMSAVTLLVPMRSSLFSWLVVCSS